MFSIILQLLATLSILVFVHELGHYLIARLFHVRVDKFFLFFDLGGKAPFKFKPKNSPTVFGIGWLPLGGYCKIAGMIDESLDKDQMAKAPEPDEFRSKPAWQRFLIMVAGVVFNIILAIVIYAGVAMHWGADELTSDKIHSGMAFSPIAKEIGFEDGDIILSINGKKEDAMDHGFIRKVVEAKEVQIKRGNEIKSIAIPDDMMQRLISSKNGFLNIQTPFVIDSIIPNSIAQRAGMSIGDSLIAINGEKMMDINDAKVALYKNANDSVILTMQSNGILRDYAIQLDSTGRIGVGLKPIDKIYPIEHINYNLFTAIPAGIKQGVNTMKGYVGDMKYVFTKEGVSQMGGFGTIGSLYPKTFNWFAFWNITALISIILGVMNLLPIPGLDGGHIMFLLYEMITRRKVSQDILIKAQIVGMIILLILVIYANANDVFRFLIKQ